MEAVENDVTIVDAHENDLVLEEEERARARTRLTFHENGDVGRNQPCSRPLPHRHQRYGLDRGS